jgi:hypothetical protein
VTKLDAAVPSRRSLPRDALAVVAVLAGSGWWLLHRRLATREPVPVAAP